MVERELTDVEERIVLFVGAFRDKHGYCASTREIGDAVGLSSTATVWVHLRVLRRDGFLLYEDGKVRTVRPAA